MNAKKCKQLRRMAEKETIGQPDRLYLRNSQTGQIIVSPKSTRGYYRRLKRAAQQFEKGQQP